MGEDWEGDKASVVLKALSVVAGNMVVWLAWQLCKVKGCNRRVACVDLCTAVTDLPVCCDPFPTRNSTSLVV